MQEAMLKNLFNSNSSLGTSEIHLNNSVLIVSLFLDSNLMILIGFLLILMLGQVFFILNYSKKIVVSFSFYQFIIIKK